MLLHIILIVLNSLFHLNYQFDFINRIILHGDYIRIKIFNSECARNYAIVISHIFARYYCTIIINKKQEKGHFEKHQKGMRSCD